METITLNDGTVLENSHVVLGRNILWFYLNGISFNDAFTLMSDPDNTVEIVAEQYGVETTYTGYTDLFSLTREDDGMITGGLNHA